MKILSMIFTLLSFSVFSIPKFFNSTIFFIKDKTLSNVLFYAILPFYLIRYIAIFILSLIIYIHILVSKFVILYEYMYFWFLFDPLYEEIVTNTSDLMVYMVRHLFIELVLPLSIFLSVMLTLFIDWSWIPISSIERDRGNSLEEVKKQLFE